MAEFPDTVSFDLPSGDFSHEQDRCTFEVLLEAFALKGRTLRKIAAAVHELDLKDGKFARPEADGVRHFIAGLVLAAAVFAGCTTQTASPAALKLGVVASMTGPASTTGRRW